MNIDFGAIIDELNRRKASAGQRLSDMFTPPQKPADWFSQMSAVPQQTPTTPEQRINIQSMLADYAKRAAEGLVPAPIRARADLTKTDPAAAVKPFTSQEIAQSTPYITAAAPIAYHGSPHEFTQFDASKIGTGQGAQSYGHGLYFAENPQTAKSYVQEFSQGNPLLTVRDKAGKIVAQGDSISDELLQQIGDAERKARMNISYGAKQGGLASGPVYMGDLKVAYEKPVGQMYRVNIPDEHVAKMLDWDKPLSEQAPEVQKAIKPFYDEAIYQLHGTSPVSASAWPKDFPKDLTAGEMYDLVANRRASSFGKAGIQAGRQQLSEELQRAGIPGIKYLDQGSRTAGQGTHNFVVFDPAILQDVSKQ